MAPSATEAEVQTTSTVHPGKLEALTSNAKPFPRRNGPLSKYEYFETTPVIGREYPSLNLVELLQASNSEELLKELALTSMLLSRQCRTFANACSLSTRCRVLPLSRQPHGRLTKRPYQ
jgi:hypothetical protein